MGSIKPILFELSSQLPGSRVLDGRPGIDPHAMAMPKGRTLGAAYARRFIEDAKSRGLVQAATIILLVAMAGWSQNPVGFTPRLLLQATQTSTGQDIQYPLSRSQVTMLHVEIAPGGQTGRHMHPVPVAVYVLEGSITVATEGKGEKTYPGNDTGQTSPDGCGGGGQTVPGAVMA